jgi:hypothetical protein
MDQKKFVKLLQEHSVAFKKAKKALQEFATLNFEVLPARLYLFYSDD